MAVFKLRKEEPKIEPKEIKEEPKIEEIIKVVKELPLAPVRDYIDENGKKIHLITIEEALTDIVNAD